MIRRDAHKPQARSGGNTALTWRNVAMLTSAAERDRSDPRVGIDSVMRQSQHRMVTFVNGNVDACRTLAADPAGRTAVDVVADAVDKRLRRS